MRRYIVLIAFLLVVLLPSLLFSRNSKPMNRVEVPEVATVPPAETTQHIRVKHRDAVTEMELDTYVLGAVLGEMPADFEMDALKAQAVATRTYTLRKVLKQNKHSDAHVCTDASCCQAFMSTDDYLSNKGNEKDLEKVRQAVDETAGQVLTYDGNLIEATYFSTSGGKTEDAAAVWGTNVPYLKSVSSPGEEAANYNEKQFRFSKEAFLSMLGLPVTAVLSEDSIDITYTEGDGVETMEIVGEVYSGTQLRSMLSLPSTAFSLSVVNDEILITTRGYGHRVGMSQYGADAMAVSGKRYDEILQHYYSGTELVTLSSDQMKAIFDKAGNL